MPILHPLVCIALLECIGKGWRSSVGWWRSFGPSDRPMGKKRMGWAQGMTLRSLVCVGGDATGRVIFRSTLLVRKILGCSVSMGIRPPVRTNASRRESCTQRNQYFSFLVAKNSDSFQLQSSLSIPHRFLLFETPSCSFFEFSYCFPSRLARLDSIPNSANSVLKRGYFKSSSNW